MDEKEYGLLQSFMVLNALYYLLVPAASTFLLCFGNIESTAIFVVTAAFLLVACTIIFNRFRLIFKLEKYFSRKKTIFSLVYQIVLLFILVAWNIVARERLIGINAVIVLQKFVAPFLITAVFALLALEIIAGQKASYHYQIENKIRYPNSKIIQKSKPYCASLASKVERAERFNKGRLIEIYSFSVLLLLFGKTILGLLTFLIFITYFAISNYRCLRVAALSSRKRNVLVFIEILAVSSVGVFSSLCSDKSIFDFIFSISTLENASYYLNLLPLYCALLLTIPSIIIRSRLKKRFAQMKQSSDWAVSP